MSNCSDFLWITLKGKKEYKCLLSPEQRIINVDPLNTYLLYKDLQEIYEKHKDNLLIKNLSLAKTPMLLDSDKFEHISKENPLLGYLAEKFDCKIL